MARTLYDKIWDEHVVHTEEDGTSVLYIDRHLVHEVTSPQAFDGLRAAGRTVRRPDLTMATEDHNVPTLDILAPIADPVSRAQVEALRANAAEFGIRLAPMGDRDQGIVHVIGPQLGLTQPGMTVVCGDSHSATHGAFGAIAFGIGTSEVEHVLATQTLSLRPFKTMAVTVNGRLPEGVQYTVSPRRTGTPAESAVTPAPSTSRVPMPSWPKQTGRPGSGRSPRRRWASVPQTPAIVVRTSTAPGSGSATSSGAAGCGSKAPT